MSPNLFGFSQLILSTNQCLVQALHLRFELENSALFVFFRSLCDLFEQQYLNNTRHTLVLSSSFCCFRTSTSFIKSLFWLFSILTTSSRRVSYRLLMAFVWPLSIVILTLLDFYVLALDRMSIDCLLTRITYKASCSCYFSALFYLIMNFMSRSSCSFRRYVIYRFSNN